MDWEAWWEWERFAVQLFADDRESPEAILTELAARVERLRSWTPGSGDLIDLVRAVCQTGRAVVAPGSDPSRGAAPGSARRDSRRVASATSRQVGPVLTASHGGSSPRTPSPTGPRTSARACAPGCGHSRPRSPSWTRDLVSDRQTCCCGTSPIRTTGEGVEPRREDVGCNRRFPVARDDTRRLMLVALFARGSQHERRRFGLHEILELFAELVGGQIDGAARFSRAPPHPRSRRAADGPCNGARWRSGSR